MTPATPAVGAPFDLALAEEDELRLESPIDSLSVPDAIPNGRSRPVSKWLLPGWEPAGDHVGCGEFGTWNHDGSGGVAHWRRGRLGCGVFGCPADISVRAAHDHRWRNGWSSRQSRRIVRRLGKRAQHFVLSPPLNWRSLAASDVAWTKYAAYVARADPNERTRKPPVSRPERVPGRCPRPETTADYRRLRTLAYEVAQQVGISRGGVFPHPFRCVPANRRGGHEGFHFHGQTDARIDPVKVTRVFARLGWIVKGLGFKPTLRVAIYQLHHGGRMLPTETKESAHLRAVSRDLVRRARRLQREGDLDGAKAARVEAGDVRHRSRLARLQRSLDPAGVIPQPNDNSAYATEAVTWFGEWADPLPDDSDGIVCPVCDKTVPMKEWYRVSWAGSGPPPEGSHGSGGTWHRDGGLYG